MDENRCQVLPFSKQPVIYWHRPQVVSVVDEPVHELVFLSSSVIIDIWILVRYLPCSNGVGRTCEASFFPKLVYDLCWCPFGFGRAAGASDFQGKIGTLECDEQSSMTFAPRGSIFRYVVNAASSFGDEDSGDLVAV